MFDHEQYIPEISSRNFSAGGGRVREKWVIQSGPLRLEEAQFVFLRVDTKHPMKQSTWLFCY